METFVGGLTSFILFHLTSHPKSRINKKIPKAKIKRIQFLPNLRIEAKNRIFHIHHWMWITPFYVFVQAVDKGILKSDLLHGFLLGGILQGLLYKDSLKFIHKNDRRPKKTGYVTHYPLRLLKKLVN